MELVINDRIRQRKVDKFNKVNINLKYNSIASPFGFDFYFDPDNIELKEMACVGHYHICKWMHEGELIMTGVMTSIGFEHSSVRHMVSIGGYSIPGFLEDCEIPTNDAIDKAIANGNLKLKPSDPKPYCYPLQMNNLSLSEIAQRLLSPFKIGFKIDSSVQALMNEKFFETTADPKDKIKHYLTSLATQKGIVMTHDAFGNIVFTKANPTQAPVHFLDVPKKGLPGVNMRATFNGQGMNSQITVMKQADADNDNSGESTVNNPFVPFVFRPTTIIQNSGSDIDTELSAKNALRDQLRNQSFVIEMDRWTVNGKIIRPGTIWAVRNPECYLFKRTNLFVEEVFLEGTQKDQISKIHCVLPSVYDGTEPVYLYKGINLH